MWRYLHLGKTHEPVLYRAHMSELHDLRRLAPGGPDKGGEANMPKSLLRIRGDMQRTVTDRTAVYRLWQASSSVTIEECFCTIAAM